MKQEAQFSSQLTPKIDSLRIVMVSPQCLKVPCEHVSNMRLEPCLQQTLTCKTGLLNYSAAFNRPSQTVEEMAKNKGKNKPYRKSRSPRLGAGNDSESVHRRPPSKKAKKAPKGHRLTGERVKGDWSQSALRNQPIVFIKASILDPLESVKLPPAKAPSQSPTEASIEVDDGDATLVATDNNRSVQESSEGSPSTIIDASEAIVDQAIGASQTQPEDLEIDSETIQTEPTEIVTEPKSTISDPISQESAESAEIQKDWKQIEENEAIIESSEERSPSDAESASESDDEPYSVYEFQENRLKVVSQSMSEMDLGSSVEDERGTDDSDVDNMSELDDDQIFALARMSRNPDAYDDDFLDDEDEGNGLDNDYDDPYADERNLGEGIDNAEFDAIMNDLLGDGPVNFSNYALDSKPPKKEKKPLSKRRQARLEAREESRRLQFANSQPLLIKYPEVISVHEVLAEISDFCKYSDAATLVFPPLDANALWYVKEIAALHGCSHSNTGKNNHKSITIIRTTRTGQAPSQGRLQRLLTRRQMFIRTDIADRAHSKASKQSTQGQAKKGPRVRDGHVVGHDAKEIAEDNVGHQLMLKMGWTQGSGLGSGLSGIPQPVVATVRLTKRGLGL